MRDNNEGLQDLVNNLLRAAENLVSDRLLERENRGMDRQAAPEVDYFRRVGQKKPPVYERSSDPKVWKIGFANLISFLK